MSALPIVAPLVYNEATDLEGLLDMLARYGKPSLSLLDGGWHCRVDMYVSSQGATFVIHSDFGMKSMRASARLCLDRVVKTLKELGV